MRAEIKNVLFPRVYLGDYVPEDYENFGICVTLYIGPVGSDITEAFEVFVRSPAWIFENFNDDKVRLLEHTVVMKSFDFPRFEAFVTTYVEKCTGNTWDEIAIKLHQLGDWESRGM